MSRRVFFLAAALVVCGVALLSFVYLNQRSVPEFPDDEAPIEAIDTSGLIGQARPDFTLAGLDGSAYRASDWDGRVMMVNFWATWCGPCRQEIPALAELQGRYAAKGLQVVGIALDDRQAVEDFLAGLGVSIPYPLLVGGEAAGIEVAKRYGNASGILPFTVVIGRDGRIAFVQFGELTFAQAERAIQGLL
jgi:thiol-disulfide isomerase/thioredoxin